MTPQPLLNAPTIIQVHAAAAVAALGLGIVQLARPKGGLSHRRLGWIWAGLMLTVAVSSIWISKEQFRLGPFSPIHLFAVLVLVMLPIGLIHARRRISRHRATMIGLFTGALVIAGLFTLAPGRILGRVLFGE